MKRAELISPQWYYLHCPYCDYLHTDIRDPEETMVCEDEYKDHDGWTRKGGCGKRFIVDGGAD